jgi:serine/threonine protein kinase
MLDAVGHYKILGRIGVGRMGELFRARDTRAGRTVAIRVIAGDIAGSPERRRQLMADARAAAALSHPSIATLYEIGEQEDLLYLVSEFVPGDSLRTAIAGRALHPRHALDHGVQLADALADGHARGVLHRDIQPGNIIVTPKGMAKFIDFGFGAWTTSGVERRQIASVAGDNAGSSELVSYMAPEEVLGRAVDERADLFSLGVVVYEILAGGPPPLVAPSVDARTIDVLLAPAPPPSTINPRLPKEFDGLLAKMLARKAEDRPASAAIVSADMRAIAAVLDARDETAPMPVATPERKTRRTGMWIGILLVVLAVIGAVIFLAR